MFDELGIAEQDGCAKTFGLGEDSSLEHRGVITFGKDHALGMSMCQGVELLGEGGLLPHAATQLALVGLPVGDGFAGHTRVHSCLGHSGADLGDETWVDSLRDEILGTELERVALIDTIDNLGYRLVGQSHDGAHGCNLHLLVDGTCIHIESTTEDVWEDDDVVDLIRIVASTCTHQHVGTSCHRILVGYFGCGVGKGEDDGLVGHRAYHILVDEVACRKAEEDIGTNHGLTEVVDVAT